MRHPAENDLALLAGGEAGGVRRLWLERHVHGCDRCQARLNEYQALRADLFDAEMPDVNWNQLAGEMKANIRLGLEAGACVRTTQAPRRWSFDWVHGWNPGLTTAVALVLLLIGSGYFVRSQRSAFDQSRSRRSGSVASAESTAPVLLSTGAGVEFRTGENSLQLLNHHGSSANQTVSAQGYIGARYIDNETGSVTITSVSLQ
jgi:hypothetical protein